MWSKYESNKIWRDFEICNGSKEKFSAKFIEKIDFLIGHFMLPYDPDIHVGSLKSLQILFDIPCTDEI